MAPRQATHFEVELFVLGPDGEPTGRIERHECDSTTHYCQADRYAFERHFHTGAGVLGRLEDFYDLETGKRRPGTDASSFNEEWMGFFHWRAIAREVPAIRAMGFDEFRERVSLIVVTPPKGEGDEEEVPAGVDPSTPDPAPV